VVIIAVRFIWVYMAAFVPRWLVPSLARKEPPPGKGTFIVAFTGIRGVVSLAAALSIPLEANGAAFPDRGLVLLATFAVILVTLVGQGFTLPWVISCLGIAEYGKKEADRDKRREIAARLASIDAALTRLDTLEGAVVAPTAANALRRRNEDRRAYFVAACRDVAHGDISNASAALQLQFLDAERSSIAEIYGRGEINDEARRRIERELDLEDARIRHAAESGAARAL
jgi:NhaP-type Na+/H+ or K+/H+ antiporter